MIQFPFKTPALRVVQPIGVLYVAVLPAELLLRVAASDVMSANINPGGVGYSLTGTQRALREDRLGKIADYIGRMDASFPNSIILAANHNRRLGFDVDEVDSMRAETHGAEPSESAVASEWTVTEGAGGRLELTIPTAEKLAAIIDGQHRLFAFTKVSDRNRLDMDLVCAIFLDLPKPYQAQLFATINSEQKPVDRSLTYELFGYNVSEETEEYWTPDKLAVFLTRKLGTDEQSPLRGRITVAPKKDRDLEALSEGNDWRVSTAVVVDGILRLISSNPKRDTNELLSQARQKERSALRNLAPDKSPLREAYLSVQDSIIYKIVENYLNACQAVLWDSALQGSFIIKTVGIQAQFDILRLLAADAYENRDIRTAYFAERIEPAGKIDFSDVKFKNASGSGRSLIRKTIADAIGLAS